VLRGRRSDFLLGGLALVAVANGLLLGLTLYGLLAAALKVVHDKAPPLGYAWLAGAVAAVALLAKSLLQERLLRSDDRADWTPFPTDPREHPLVDRFAALVAASSLDRPPRLGWADSAERNAFTVGPSRDRAAIVLTAGLIEYLSLDELNAILAQQLAHVETEDVKAVGLADAVADSVADLSRAKGRFLWGPKAIFADMSPLLLGSIAGLVFVAVLPQFGADNSGLILLYGVISLILLYNLWQEAKRSWRGLAQLFLFITFLGPTSLVEAALAPPTAIALSRLVSRARVHEADARAVELTKDRAALISALQKLETNGSPPDPWLARRRFSLFIASEPVVEGSYRRWIARLYTTHPSIASRLETLNREAAERG
jgi:Zn-dependent protease with chaperone function